MKLSLTLGVLLAGFAFLAAPNQERAEAAVKFDRQWNVPLNRNSVASADDLAIGRDGTVYVAVSKRIGHRASIWKYSEEGKSLGRIVLKTPWVDGIDIDPDGSIVVVGTDVLRYRPDGKLIGKWKTWGDNRSPVHSGTEGISIDSKGRVYSASPSKNAILRLDRNGKIQREYVFREKSGRPREFYDVAVAPDDSIYAIDDSYYLHHFAADGRHLGKFGGRGSGPLESEWWSQISVGPDGTIYLMDGFYSRVQAFDARGRLVDSWGGDGVRPGSFDWAVFGLASTEGAVYALEAGGRLQRFETDDAPPIPAPIFSHDTLNWFTAIDPGRTAKVKFLLRNLGDAPATGVKWCLPDHVKSRKFIVSDSRCKDLGSVPARSRKTFAVKVKAPARKGGFGYEVRIKVISDQTGPSTAISFLRLRGS